MTSSSLRATSHEPTPLPIAQFSVTDHATSHRRMKEKELIESIARGDLRLTAELLSSPDASLVVNSPQGHVMPL